MKNGSQSTYGKLSSISVKSKIERKGSMDYLSWANAWDMLKKEYPTAQRNVYESEHTGFNYFTDGKSAWVKVGIVIEEVEHIDYLPIMDFRNNSIRIDKVSSTDVNKTIQRSTTKAIAMHGLGLSLWTGEDVPELVAPKKTETKLITLKKGDANWKGVSKYVLDNRSMGVAKLTASLGRKYNITASLKKDITNLIK